MKVCFLNHNLDPKTGAGRFGCNLIERLMRAGPDREVLVLTSVGSGHPLEQAVVPQRLLDFVFVLPKVRRIFKECDIIHALDGYPYGVLAYFALFGIKKPFIITAIGTGAVQPLYRWHGWLLGLAYKRADRVVAISNYTRGEILKKIPNLKINVINHAVDYDEFRRDPDRELSNEEQSAIKRLKPYIVSVGSWKKRKGFEYSFAAFAELAKDFPNLNYVICGIGEKSWLSDAYGITGRVFYFKGARWPFLKALYQNAELFMLLPHNDGGDIEGFGFAFIEAAAAGLPVVGTHHSGAQDAVLDGQNGFLVEPKNSIAAAEAATRILSDMSLNKRFRAGSIEFAKTMNWEQVIEKYQALYKELCPKLKRKARTILATKPLPPHSK